MMYSLNCIYIYILDSLHVATKHCTAIKAAESDPNKMAAPHYEDLKLSNFGFQMRMSGFTGFLAWSGMGVALLGILVSMALLTLPSDLSKHIAYCRGGTRPSF